MRTPAPRSRTTPRASGRRSQALTLLAALPLALPLAVLAPAQGASEPLLDTQPPPATTFEISSFNLLGHGHTEPGGTKPGYASGPRRMGWAVRIIEAAGVDVVGFQELERPQYDKFMALRGTQYGIYPGLELGRSALANSVAWRLDEWSLVSATTVRTPYFHGTMRRNPVVLLQNVHTGQQAWFMNTHNPANARGPAQRWRDASVRIQAGMVNSLRAASPNIPVLFTGDMNDREKFFCPLTASTGMVAANGGTNIEGVCQPPVPTRIDWIMGTRDVTFTSYATREDAFVKKTTDHPVVLATASIPPLPVQDSPIRRVVVLDIEGLSSRALRRAGATRAPRLTRLMSQGASTLNARTTDEQTRSLPNLVTMLTGRRVAAPLGGHGVVADRDDGATTIERLAGRYVSSAFDLVHDSSRRTALYSSDRKVALVARSWDAEHGAPDGYGVDDGRGKISQVVSTKDDATLVGRLNAGLTRAPKAYAFAHLSMLAESGRENGWGRREYMRTLTEVDHLVGDVIDTIAARPALQATTLLLVAADSGGDGYGPEDASNLNNYRVPLLVWGPGVVPGADLYAINPAYVDPGTARVGYTGTQPIRVGVLANLVAAVLHLPAIPGSEMNARQDFNIFVGPGDDGTDTPTAP